MRDVTPQVVQDLVRAKLESGLSVQTCIHIRNAVSAIFRHAKRLRAYSGDLPTEGVRLPTLVPKERRAMTWNQVQALAANLPDKIASLISVMALTGLRVAEAIGLGWKYVDLEGGILYVRESFRYGKYQDVKSVRSRRDIPLHSIAVAELRRLGPKEPESPVFASRNGTPLNAHNISNRMLKQAAALAGMGTPENKEKRIRAKSWVSFHVLRHTASTLAEAAGMSLDQRRAVLGHSAAAMTMRYTHPELEKIREGLERIGKEKVN